MAAEVIVYVKIFLVIGIESRNFVNFVGNHTAYIKFQVIGKAVPVGVILPVFLIVRVIGGHTVKFTDIINNIIVDIALLFEDG